MRSHRSWCVFFIASLGSLLGTTASLSHAQSSPSYPLQQKIWKAVEPGANGSTSAAPSAASLVTSDASSVRQAYFQGPGEMAMPQLPSTGMMSPAAVPPQLRDSSMNSNSAMNAPAFGAPNQNAGAVSPASFNQFSNPGGPMQATQVQQQTHARLRSADSLGNTPSQGQYSNPQGAYRQTAMQQPVLPPGTYSNSGGYPAQQPNLPPSQFRNDNFGVPSAAQPQARMQVPVVSSDPRFVMPAPKGNYPTVPYQGPYRTVSYQLPQQNPAPQPVQPPSALPNQPQVVPMTSPLPQYAQTVGVQPINYQALQPGYCAPNIPSNGVPAFVPGSVVPPTLPPNLTPQLYTPDNAGYRPLFSLGQENYNVQLGRGIIGQPTVYVAGQPVRNFMRYIFP